MFNQERSLLMRALGRGKGVPFSLTYGSIFRVIFVLAGIWVLYNILDVVAILFFGVILSSTIAPGVDMLKKEGVPRILGTLLIYLCIIIGFSFVIYIIVPETIVQLSHLNGQLPGLLGRYLGSSPALSQEILANIRGTITDSTLGIGTWLVGLVGGLGNVIFVFIISFYLTVEDHAIKDSLRVTLPVSSQEYALDLIHRSQNTLSSWLKSQLLLMLMVGILMYIGLSIVGVPFKLVLAIVAGLFEIIPIAGPIMASIPAILFSVQVSPQAALLTLAICVAVQQLETHVLTPLVVKHTLAINPILVLLAIFVGFKLGGIIGVLASIPLLALFLEFSKDYTKKEEAVAK